MVTTTEIKKQSRKVTAQPQEQRPYVSVRLVSKYMGMCPQSIIAWIKNGQLEGERIGQSYKIPLTAFEELKQKFPRPESEKQAE